MKVIYLISENKVRTMTNMSTNVNSKFLLTAIQTAQLEYEYLIGTKLYNKLVNLVDTDSITDAENICYKDLLDKSQYYLAYMTMIKISPILTYHYDNLGVSTQSDEHIQSITTKELFQIMDYYEREADSLKDRLQKYLLKHKDDYPELEKEIIDGYKAELKSSASTHIFLGGRRGKRPDKCLHNHYKDDDEKKIEYTKYKINEINLINLKTI